MVYRPTGRVEDPRGWSPWEAYQPNTSQFRGLQGQDRWDARQQAMQNFYRQQFSTSFGNEGFENFQLSPEWWAMDPQARRAQRDQFYQDQYNKAGGMYEPPPGDPTDPTNPNNGRRPGTWSGGGGGAGAGGGIPPIVDPAFQYMGQQQGKGGWRGGTGVDFAGNSPSPYVAPETGAQTPKGGFQRSEGGYRPMPKPAYTTG